MSYMPSISAADLRDMFRASANKIPPDLRQALTHLDMTSIADLEERLLATTAFLAPWATYRDTCLLVNSIHCDRLTAITRTDILWFYTQFDQGVLRHDPCAERPGATFEIDKSKWGAAEHEKHLFAWLLQAFCVGKTRSSFGFRYFELRNICTAWKEVFLPIVKAVRASYSVKGRKHYGRLALFIEDRCPSRLAFPEGNVSMPHGVIDSPPPSRMVSRTTHVRGASQTLMTRTNYDEAERELRDVYPQYGGLVERPRFKQKMEEWLKVQRMRATYRNTITKPEFVQYVPRYQTQFAQQVESRGNGCTAKASSPDKRSPSPLKRYSNSIRRSLSVNVGSSLLSRSEPQAPLSSTRPRTPDTPQVPAIPYGKYSYVPKISKEEPKSPFHGVTRPVHIADEESGPESKSSQMTDVTCTTLPDNDTWSLPAARLRRPESLKQQLLGQNAYTAVSRSNSSSEVTFEVAMPEDDAENRIWSPMGAPSAIRPSLKQTPAIVDQSMPRSLLKTKKPFLESRQPSYEGNGYRDEISLRDLHSRDLSTGSDQAVQDLRLPRQRSRLPAPIQLPPAYATQTYVASDDTYRNDVASRLAATEHPSEPYRSVAWSDSGDALTRTHSPHAASALAPPIPPKSPERWASRRGQMPKQPSHHQTVHEDVVSHEMLRIVSKENIRAALGNLTPHSSMEDLRAQAARKAPARVPGPLRLEPYNTHMFPKKK
ncbi:hypothetical protein SVAN01_03938 [Stagonosporopsis vannaccii]|nr:hypothetical protein SVAN01_03938 [Stagonosporopsis vannaccii]